MRVFIGADLPDSLKDDLADLKQKLLPSLPSARWVKNQNLHITLKFLGEINPSEVDDISKALSTVLMGQTVFDLSLKSLGAFPSTKRVHVIWMGIDKGLDELIKIGDIINAALSHKNDEDIPPLKPHITICRTKEKVDLSQIIAKTSSLNRLGATETVRSVNIYESKLMPNGPVYEKIFEVGLTIDNRT
ncbi:MAG: RNA 2',3'-cyclic phosphodiesterase [Actinomycetota bacterium]|nr:RNA 2',3'-cyclic phosphodiesterase [Actinomycetota bacterium]